MKINIPLIYSCSGCSNVAQLANNIALGLDRDGTAEMSCIAGVGGGVKSLVNKAKSGRSIVALDGCALGCVQNCLQRHNVQADLYYLLTDYDVKKQYKTEPDREDIERIGHQVRNDIHSGIESVKGISV